MVFHGVEICCPICRGELAEGADDKLVCRACQHYYPIILGIPDLRVFPDPYIDIEADRAKGLQIAEKLDELDFPSLVEYYYSITDVVPARHAKQYTRGLLAASSRAEAALFSWHKQSGLKRGEPLGTLLEIGCGTGPLLVAAAKRYRQVVGVDIAFRWLVVAKKRLQEAGLDIPLICACAEALPFASDQYDHVVMDSVLEMVDEQSRAVQECRRTLKNRGYFFIATPNKYSLGPDPHTGIFAGGYLPERWTAKRVIAQGGIPPKRNLLWRHTLARLLRHQGFKVEAFALPAIPKQQMAHFGGVMRVAAQVYNIVQKTPVSREMLYMVGPILYAIAQKDASVRIPSPS